MYKEYGMLVKGNLINMIGCFIVSLLLIGLFGVLSFREVVEYFKIDSEVEAYEIIKNCDEDKDICKPVFHYLVDGKEYVCDDLGSFREKELKDIKMVYYDKDDPGFCTTDLEEIDDILLYVLFFVSVLLFILMIYGLVKAVKHYSLFRKIKVNAKLYKKVKCSIERRKIVFSDFGEVIISCEIELDDDKKQNIVSKRYMNLDESMVKTIDVLINVDNPELYIVDFNIS